MELTTKTATKAAKWFCKIRGIEDWTINGLICDQLSAKWLAELSPVDDDTVGLAVFVQQRKIAWVWVSPSRCGASSAAAKCGADPWSVFFHECCHVWARSIGIEDDEGSSETFEQAWHADGAFFASMWEAINA